MLTFADEMWYSVDVVAKSTIELGGSKAWAQKRCPSVSHFFCKQFYPVFLGLSREEAFGLAGPYAPVRQPLCSALFVFGGTIRQFLMPSIGEHHV